MNSETNISYDHQCRLISEFLKDSFPSLIAFGSIGITYFATAQRIQDYLCEKSGFVERVSLFKNIIEESTCFNIWFFFCLCSLFIYSGISIINKKSPNYSLKILLLVIVSLLFLWYENEWVYAKLFFIDYRWLTTIGIIVLAILSLHSLIKWVQYIFKEYKVKDNTLKPFSNDLPLSKEKINESCNLAKFIHFITTILFKSNKCNENKDKQKDNIEKNTSLSRRKKAKEIITKHRILAKYIHYKAALFRKIKKNKDNKDELQKDNNKEKKPSLTREKIAKEIVNRLNITPVLQESYAICISGAWGSGKTTFLNYLKEEIIKSNKEIGLENNIIEFHPWRSCSSSLIIDDFFNLLRNNLKGKIPGVEDDLITYINLLLKFDEPTVKVATPFLDHLFKYNQKEIDDSKRVIAEQLSYLNHKIYIFIDDIDRLESNELLSVLRLIRNSANFPNLFFIAALDKQYVCDNLEAAKYKDGKSFLEKIFQVEFALPRIDKIDIIDLLRTEIRHNLSLPPKKTERILVEISNTEEKRKILNNIITNFRIAKRLVRQFTVLAQFMMDNLDKEEYVLGDLFYLEMLHYIDPTLYDRLSHNPSLFFDVDFNKQSGNFWYLKDGLKEELSNSPRYSYDILIYLFSKDNNLKRGRLALKANYFNYFCLSQPRFMVKLSDFQEMISSRNGNDFSIIENKVKKWCRSQEKSRDSMDSIYNGFRCSLGLRKKYNIYEIKPYLAFTIFWAVYEHNYNQCIVEALKSVLNGRIYLTDDDKVAAKSYFEENIQKYIDRKDIDLIHLVWVLSQLYRFDNVYKKYLIDNDFIKTLIIENCFEQCISISNLEAQSLLQKGTLLNEFATKSVVLNTSTNKKLSLTINKIITYYTELEEKSKYIYKTAECYPAVVVNNKNDSHYYDEIKELETIFGSDNTQEKFFLYLERCFDKERAIRSGINQLEDK